MTACTCRKLYEQDFGPRCLQLHFGVLIDVARQCNTPVTTSEDVVEMLLGNKGEQLQYLFPEVAKLVKIPLTSSHTMHIRETVIAHEG